MDALDRKLLRDFARLWAQFLAIALVLAAGVAILLMSYGMSRALDDTRATYYERNRFADIFTDARSVPLSLLEAVRAIDGVAVADPRVTTYATLDIDGKQTNTVAYIASLPEVGEPLLNVPLLRRGDMPDPLSNRDVLLHERFAMANGLMPGDTFNANINGSERALRVSGWALSPEFIYTIGPGSLMPNNEDFGVIWMPERPLAGLLGRTGAFDNLSVTLQPGVQAAPVIDALDALLTPYGSWGAIGRDMQLSNSFIESEIVDLRMLAYILPPIFLGIAVFLVNLVIGRVVALERSEIGLLKALGYSKTTIAFHYLLLSSLVAAVGVLIGWGAGGWLSYGMSQLYAQFFDFPYLIYNISWGAYVASGLLGVAAAGLGALNAALRAARLSPAIAMQPPAPPRYNRNLIDRALIALRLSQPSMMILRNIVRWPVRAALSILGLSLAVAVLVASNFFPAALDAVIDKTFFQSSRQHAVLFFSDAVPVSVIEEVRDLPGVMQAEGQLNLTAILRNAHLEKRVGVEARLPGQDLARVVDAEGRVVEIARDGLLLPERLATQLNVSVGDELEVEFLGNRRGIHTLPVAGLVTQYFGLGAYVSQDTINRVFQQAPQVNAVNVTLDSAHRAEFEARLRDLPRLAGSTMMDDNLRSFQDTINQNIVLMTSIYGLLGVLLTVGVAYNSARIQLSERARELGSLRILGFTRGEVGYILIGEIMLLALVAQPIGWLIGWGIAKSMVAAFTSDLYAIPLVLTQATFANASLIVLASALASVAIVLRRLHALDLVAVMKTRE